jgi:hypothetical protein
MATGLEKAGVTLPDYSQATAVQTSFASVSLHMTDRIRFLLFSQQDLASVRSVLKTHWHKGIQNERPYNKSQEFKLNGRPWSGSGTGSDSIPAIIMIRELLAHLYSRGWILTAATDISKKEFDKDTLIFRKQPVLPPVSWLGISFVAGDKIRLVGAPQSLVVAFRSLLQSTRHLQEDRLYDQMAGCWQFKLNGYPWHAKGEETMSTRLLVLRIIETLEGFGWSLYASIDQWNGPGSSSSSSETDCWYCVKAEDWIPGKPVFHR